MKNIKNISLSSGFKKALKNTGFLTVERILNLVLAFIGGVFVARYLGPDNYGMLKYSTSLIALVVPISILGTKHIVIRDLVKNPENENYILGTTFILILSSSILLSIIVAAIGYILNTGQNIIQVLIIINSVNLIFNSFRVFDYWFRSKIKAKHSVIARSASQLLLFILKILFVFLSLSVIWFGLIIIFGAIIRSLLWLLQYKNYNKKIKNWYFDKKYAIYLLKNTWPLILSSVSVAIYMKLDQVMLKEMLDSEAVGNYAIAVRISELWYFIPTAVCSSVFPIIIKTKQRSIKQYYDRLQYLYDIMSGFAIAIAIPVTFLSDTIINFLFGSSYSQAGPVLALHIWAAIFVFLGVARSNWIINENLQKYGMIFTISGGISNIFLNLWLIPKIGIMGAAIATVISQIISAWFLSVIIKKTRKAFFMQLKSITRAILIYPMIKSARKIYNEAVNK